MNSQELAVMGGSCGNDEGAVIASVPNTRSLSSWPHESVCMGGESDLLCKRKNDVIFFSD